MADIFIPGAIIALIGSLASFNIWPHWFLRLRARNWPTVSGTVESGEVSVSRGRYGELFTATLSYSYRVDEQYYGGSDSKVFNNDEKGAWDYVTSQKEAPALVTYNPKNPETSVLRR